MCKGIKLVAVFLALVGGSHLYAQELSQPSSAASQVAAKTTEPAESAAGSSLSGLNESFAQVAELGQQISLAQKKIQALKMKKELEALENSGSAANKPLGFKILRIEGFGSVLYAMLRTDNGGIIQVGPGEQVNETYRVVLITSSSVKVYDVKTRKVYTVPFYVPGEKAEGKKGNHTAAATGAGLEAEAGKESGMNEMGGERP
jgi:hypothetical protein